MAQDLGIDIKKHNEMLPENNKDCNSQKHTLLEVKSDTSTELFQRRNQMGDK